MVIKSSQELAVFFCVLCAYFLDTLYLLIWISSDVFTDASSWAIAYPGKTTDTADIWTCVSVCVDVDTNI